MAGNLERRIEAMEKRISAADCICERAENQVRLVVIDPSWPPERVRTAEDAAARVNCPVHPGRRVPIVRLSPTDAML